MKLNEMIPQNELEYINIIENTYPGYKNESKEEDIIRDFESGYLGPQTPQVDPIVESVRKDFPLRNWLESLYKKQLDSCNYIKSILTILDNEV